MYINSFISLLTALLIFYTGCYLLLRAKNDTSFESPMPMSTWIQPKTPIIYILELEWTIWHKAKKYGRKLFKGNFSNLQFRFYTVNNEETSIFRAWLILDAAFN